MTSSSADSDMDVVIERVDRESESVVAITMTRADGGVLPGWEPGAHVELVLPSGLIRHYSLCGDPNDTGRYVVAVLLEEEGRGGSRELHAVGAPGQALAIRDVRNNFPLAPADEYVFLAGGIGVTPLLPMIDQAIATQTPWHLVFGGRSRSTMAYLSRLDTYPADRVSLFVEDEPSGRPDFADIVDHVSPGTAVYACGPGGMLDHLIEVFAEKGKQSALHIERFSVEGDTIDTSGPSFEVELSRTGKTVVVGADETILEAVRSVGIEPSFSCDEGYCGTCETFVLDGTPDHRDTFLTEDEREENGSMMICVSRCIGDRLVLDL